MSAPIREAAIALRELRANRGVAALEAALARMSDEDAAAIARIWEIAARAKQLPPAAWEAIWLIVAGRGFGKTRTGSETTLTEHEDRGPFEGALVSKTMTDLERDMVRGESGLIRCGDRRGIGVRYVANKRVEITSAIGTSILHVMSAEQDEFGRGPNISFFWADEIAAWVAAAFARFRDGFLPSWRIPYRDGGNMRAVITTSPKPNAITRWLMHSPEMRPIVTLTGGKSEENRHIRLNPHALAIRGSRTWLQEYEGMLLDSSSLVSGELVATHRVDRYPAAFSEIVIGIDPGVRAKESADETGMVVVGFDHRIPVHGYVLADLTRPGLRGIEWARNAVRAALEFGRLCGTQVTIVAETNNGGDLILDNVRTAIDEIGGAAHAVQVRGVFATASKRARAEAIAGFYEVGRVHHVNSLPGLEGEWATWVEGAPSPNRLDAAVHALAHRLVGDALDPYAPLWTPH